ALTPMAARCQSGNYCVGDDLSSNGVFQGAVGWGHTRQNDPELGAFARLCIDLNRPAMVLDDDVIGFFC
ncbi:MAG: hypothetical protein WCD65_07825, partial [Pseudolabrys sp.]